MPFDLAAVSERLRFTRFAGKLRHFETIDSTNLQALAAAAAGAPDGTVLIADEQTAGRGRGGHTWHSAPGDGLYLSAIVTPRVDLAQALWISLSTGLAVQQAILRIAQMKADIRWPNDILLGERKCAGILVESTSTPTHHLRHAVIGIGINVNHAGFPPELASLATSLRIEALKRFSREELAASLLLGLDAELYALELELQAPATGDRPSSPGLLARFTAASTWASGRRVRVDEAGGYTGTTAGLDRNGFLLVEADDGTLRTVLSGGVRPHSKDA